MKGFHYNSPEHFTIDCDGPIVNLHGKLTIEAHRVDNSQISKVIRKVKGASAPWKIPVVTQISRKKNPFRVLVSCILSLRTRDEVTDAASQRLFALANSPEKLSSLKKDVIEKAIYPAAFYRNKAETLSNLCRELIHRFEGAVPDTLEELLSFKGVGRKTANLTLTLGHGKPGICVDTHVHRICNRWGYVATKNPDATEMALRKKLPKKYWIEINDLLVSFGQNICKPVSPLCSQCCVSDFCPKIGVGKRR
jgi:endonuclease III